MAGEPIKWNSKSIMVKPEVTYGVDAVPTGAANAMLMTDVQLQPMEGQDVSRNLEQPAMGGEENIPTGIYVVLTGSVELVGSGTAGVAPGWAPLLRACGVAEVVTAATKVEYSPVSDNHESFCAYFQIGPSRHVITGIRATGVLTVNAQGIPVLRVTMTGLFSVPADAARPVSIDVSAFKDPQVATNTNTPLFTIGGASFAMRSFEMNLGCDVQPRLLVGTERIVIVDRAEVITTQVEAVPYATYNPFAIAQARTKQVIALQHGTVVGCKVRLDVPIAQQRRPTGFQNQQGVTEWSLAFGALPSTAFNDQWKLTLT